LCLGQTIRTQQGYLSSPPSIWAEPGLSILQGHHVTIVCSSANGYDIFHVEKGNDRIEDKKNPQPAMREARFHLSPVNKSTAGHYHCICYDGHDWSPQSETPVLKMISEDVSQVSNLDSAVTS
ncbi:leukocyte-associated immunoglobulin-like receptor 1, partial [Sigmodon hispidus]